MPKTKYQGIDSREIKCVNNSETSIKSGISFDYGHDDQRILFFHFLEYKSTGTSVPKLTQTTKAMYLDNNTIDQLIKRLKELRIK